MAYTAIVRALSGEMAVESVVHCQGWVRTKRSSKAGITFIHLHDGSCFDAIQVVVPTSLSNYAQEIDTLTTGAAIQVSGILVPSLGQGQHFEIQAESVTVVGRVEQPESYPLAPKRHSLEHLRDVAHLRPRTNTIGAVTRVRHRAMMAIHQFLTRQNFLWVNTPIITASDTEGAGELFTVSTLDPAQRARADAASLDYKDDFFGKRAYLTVSGQLNVEAYCLSLSKVYTFGPTFRAENSNTSRHLAEFWMVEPEIAFAQLLDNAALAEQLLKFVISEVLHHCADDMAFFNQRIDSGCLARLESVVQAEFEIMEYAEAIQKLQQAKKEFSYPVQWGLDLQTEHERYLTETLIGRPVTVINYPKEIKAFYMRLNDDDRTVAAMDILAPGIGEIIGGSEREDRLTVLDARMDEVHLDKSLYNWYRDLRRYGSVPHAGFGLGFERLLLYMTGLGNIRDVIPFPRTPKNVSF